MNYAVIESLIRQVLLTLGASLVTKGYIDAETLQAVVGALMVLIASGWAIYTRRAAGLAKAAVAESPSVVMQELAASPLVKQIVTTTNTTANAVPSPKVVGPAG